MSKASIRIADAFYNDARDFLDRFNTGKEAWSGRRSERVKWCVDLRFAYETALKAIIAWRVDSDEFLVVYQAAVSGGHNLVRLAEAASDGLEELGITRLSALSMMACLPVDLRYNLDGVLFREHFEEWYYSTCGNDPWLTQAADEAERITDGIGARLSSESTIVNASDVRLDLDPMTAKQGKWIKEAAECMEQWKGGSDQ
ncbi:MAG: hypothetical protein ACTS3F_08250 [Phycisphaerales bacterium]